MSPIDIISEVLSNDDEIRAFCKNNDIGSWKDHIFKLVIQAYLFLSKKINFEQERQNLLSSVNLPVNSTVDSRGQKIIQVSGSNLITMPIPQNASKIPGPSNINLQNITGKFQLWLLRKRYMRFFSDLFFYSFIKLKLSYFSIELSSFNDQPFPFTNDAKF